MVSRCCCCFSVKTGAYIIGCFHVFGLLIGLYILNVLQIAIDAFCGVTFLLMVYKDSEMKRLMYFTSYVIYSIIVGIIRLIFVFWGKDEQGFAQKFCTGVNDALENGEMDWKNTDFTSQDDCKSKVLFAMQRDEFIGYLILLLLQLHFVSVLY